MKYLKVTTKNEISVVDVSNNPGSYLYAKLANAIGCSIIERVNPLGLPDPYCMFVDEEGLLKERPVLNPIGSYLYGYHEHGNPTVGDILIGKNIMTDEGPDVGGLDEQDIQLVRARLESLLAASA